MTCKAYKCHDTTTRTTDLSAMVRLMTEEKRECGISDNGHMDRRTDSTGYGGTNLCSRHDTGGREGKASKPLSCRSEDSGCGKSTETRV